MAELFKVYYSINQTNKHVEGSKPVLLNKPQIYQIAESVSQMVDNFIGFVDSKEYCIQFYINNEDEILFDIPLLKKKGSFTKIINRNEFFNIIENIGEPFEKYFNKNEFNFEAWNKKSSIKIN